MNDKMTFTVTAYGKTVTITQPEDLNIHEFLDTCRQLAMVMEYHEESWDDAIIAAADSLSDHFLQDQVDRYERAVAHKHSGNTPIAHNPLASKREMWLHSDGQMRDYPDIDNITLPSDC
jgi:flagellar biosynthesis chaperone FliJ